MAKAEQQDNTINGSTNGKMPEETRPTEGKKVNPFILLGQDLALPNTAAVIDSWENMISLSQNDVLPTMRELAHGLEAVEDSTRWANDLMAFVDGSLLVLPKVKSQSARTEMDNLVNSLVQRGKNIDSRQAAEMLIKWDNKTLTSLRDLLDYVGAPEFDEVGKLLSTKLAEAQKPVDISEFFKAIDENGKSLISLSPALRSRLIDCFVEVGYLSKTQNKYKLTERGRRKESLGYGELLSAVMATEQMGLTFASRRFRSLTGIETHQERFNDRNRMTEVHLALNKSNIKILLLSEVLFGHKDLDMSFLRQLLASLKKLPKESLPDAIVVSGLVQGTFKYRNKDRRATLSIASGDDQFAAARILLDELESLGPKIIYNIGSEDREICHNYTIDTIQMLQHYGKPLADKDKFHVAYYQIDKMKQTQAWDIHYNFQVTVAFPYMLRSGRRLRSADEIARATGHELRMEEYLMLFDTYHALREGKEPNPLYTKILNMENIPVPGKETKGFLITDDIMLKTILGDSEKRFWIRHNLKFGDKPMYQNPIDAAEALAGQLAAGDEALSAVIFQHQQQAVGLKRGDTWMISAAGMLKPDLEQRGTIFSVSGDSTWRQVTTRRILPTAAATLHELGDDGRHSVTFFTERFLNLAKKVPDRTTVAFFNDWQNGSVTARPDLQVKYADMVFRQYLPDRPVYLFFLGDIIQAQNYKGMSMENANIGLDRIDHQTDFVSKFLNLAFADVPAEHLKHLRHVGIVPGNHEWNSGFQQYGAVFSHYPEDLIEKLFLKKGLTDAPVKFYDTVSTKSGDYLKTWAGFIPVAGHGLLFQHIMLEKGGKGSSDKPPIYQAQEFYSGMGDLVKPVDISVHGHWHFAQYALFGGKLAVVSPALAGVSGFEYVRGLRSDIGATLVHLGGGQPVTVEFLTPQSLYRHDIQSGFFSPSHLRNIGFKDDENFDPTRNGFANRLEAHSALQKVLWRMIDEITNASHSTLG